MTRFRDLVQVAVPFLWLGMVLSISLIEAPLKFRAPGVTLPIGLGIGRLVFRALNAAEIVLLAGLTVAAFGTVVGAGRWMGIGALWLILLTQAAVLRPLLDRRAQMIIDGLQPPPSSLHLWYVALEVVKILVLLVLGWALAERLLR
ncbi:hypothetical protein QTQ03_03410 [Micromonospora sp. WMMA1363]|uniref:hypothetical protein n=1 Tax=Micromonospora sp. WMMA1363 TaxID=3053985 RepID=UPI00259D1B0D|nr:hypothetical protein [Micromonospora sp. WMMA1363]MDM4718687.1 hypothetical protein [Micromonospora sp. WMMA1363]